MSFATPKEGRPHLRSNSPIRPKSASAAAISRPRSPKMKAPIPKQNIKRSAEVLPFSANGNVGNDVVMQIFEKIHQTSGGMRARSNSGRVQSARDKLRRLGTKPTEDILKKQMWKEYFGKGGPSNSSSFVSSKDDKNKDHAAVEKKQGQPPENKNDVEEVELNYSRLYYQLVKRINHLWKELKIPLCDRDFYSVAIIKGKFKNEQQIDDMSCYVKRLLDHRKCTIRVMQNIRERENLIEQCNLLISTALRYMNLKFSTLHDDILRNMNKDDPNGIDEEQLNRDCIKQSILKLQESSGNVIRMIKLWRNGLWRPQPFMYKGDNYLIKMNTDLSFLKSKSVKRVLDSIPLVQSDLICVVFDSPEYGNVELGDQMTSQDKGQGEILISSDHLDVTPAKRSETSDSRKKELDDDLESLALIVKNESNVQKALKMENSALRARGTFIPSLRFEFDDECDANLLK